MATIEQRITPMLWYDGKAEEAANFYCAIFENSRVTKVSRYGESGPGPKGSVMVAEFEIEGQKFTALNAGPQFKFNESVSFVISCQSQDEVDYYWDRLSAGGKEVQCGWLQDRFGLSWQVTPSILPRLLQDPDPAKSQRVMKAMLQMIKIDIAGLERAYHQA